MEEHKSDGVVLRSEFATVHVVLDRSANGPRLAITDLRSGKTNYFDPIELEALVWVDHDEITQFMLPARRWLDGEGWVDDDDH